jgi:hypothetical protein
MTEAAWNAMLPQQGHANGYWSWSAHDVIGLDGIRGRAWSHAPQQGD